MLRAGLMVAASVLMACAPESTPQVARHHRGILGGTPSTAADAPSTGAILVELTQGSAPVGSFKCTGVLIAPDVVLTAGHCTVNEFDPLAAAKFYFTFTRDVRSYEGMDPTLPPRTVEIREMLAHPDFDIDRFLPGAPPLMGLANFSDVALAFLEAPVVDVTPAVLVQPEDVISITVGSTVSIAGYGLVTPDGRTQGVMHHADSVINELGTHEMQIGDVAPTPQKCHGDSGGPSVLVVQDGLQPAERVIGITSRAYAELDCDEGGVDTRVDAFASWIISEMVEACRRGVRVSCAGGGWPPRPGPMGPIFADAGAPDAEPLPPDAGEPDAGASLDAEIADAGSELGDATVPTSRADAAPTVDGGDSTSPPTEEGCGCHSTRSPPAAGALAVGWLAALVASRRRRSRR